MNKKETYGPLLLRIALAALFLTAGITKLTNPAGTAAFFGNLGLEPASFLAWTVLLSEILFGSLILVGLFVRLAVWPLALIMVIAIFKVALPAYMGGQTAALTNVWFHLVAFTALASLYLTGAGAMSIGGLMKKASDAG